MGGNRDGWKGNIGRHRHEPPHRPHRRCLRRAGRPRRRGGDGAAHGGRGEACSRGRPTARASSRSSSPGSSARPPTRRGPGRRRRRRPPRGPATFMARFGARYAHVLPEWKLKRSFGAFLLVIAVILLARPGSWADLHRRSGAWTKGVGAALDRSLRRIPLRDDGRGWRQHHGPRHGAPGRVSRRSSPRAARCSPWSRPARRAPTPTGGSATSSTWLLPGLIPGILVGTFVGSSLAVRLPEVSLRLVFAAVLVWTGSKYIRARTAC